MTANNVAFLQGKINGFKADIEHLKSQIERGLDSATIQKLQSQKVKCTEEMLNYIEMLDQYKHSA